MTTLLSDPDNPTVQVNWDELDDEGKQRFADRCRATYISQRDLARLNHWRFDAKGREAKVVPEVVRQWERRHDDADGQSVWLIHPLLDTELDWTRASRASRVLIVQAFEQAGVDAPDFVSKWYENDQQLKKDDLGKELLKFRTEESTIQHHLTLAADSIDRALETTAQTSKVFKDIVANHDNPFHRRKEFHDLFDASNSTYLSACRHQGGALYAQQIIHDDRAHAHGVFMKDLRIRHQKELDEAQRLWDEARKQEERLFEQPMEVVTNKVDRVAQARKRLMEGLWNFREAGLLPNLGHNVGSMRSMEQVSPGDTILSNKQMQYVTDKLFPLLREKKKQAILDPLGDKVFAAKNLLHKAWTKEGLERLSVKELTMVLDVYQIKKPDDYAEVIGWLGDGATNYAEYAQMLRAQENQYLKQQAMEAQAKAMAEAEIKRQSIQKNPDPATTIGSSETETSPANPSVAAPPVEAEGAAKEEKV